ncbi:MAG: lysophospholipid acyltransferase family protein [Paracoccaceae bacterium]
MRQDPFPIRLLKRTLLVLLGPFYFLYIGFVPLMCRGRPGFRGWYWRTVKRSCSRLLRLLSIRVEMSDAHKQELAADTNSVIVINHRSHLDGFALMDAVPDTKWFTFAAKKELCDSVLLSTGFKAAGLVEIDRASGKVAMGTLSAAVREMPERRSVVLFPEGTRSREASLAPFKAGAVIVAREAARTIRPIVVHGSDHLLPRGRFVPKSGVIRMEVLPPFECDPDGSVDDDVARLQAAMTTAFDHAR